MKSIIHLLAMAIAAPATATPNAPDRPPVGHPLIGKWQWTRSTNNCTEIYDFRADGTVFVSSGEEKTENVYIVASDPDPNGFYRLTMRVTKDYGGRDCANDEADSTGEESTSFILFSPRRDQYASCYEARLKDCFGPLRRVQP